jgi:hypothetical protein
MSARSPLITVGAVSVDVPSGDGGGVAGPEWVSMPAPGRRALSRRRFPPIPPPGSRLRSASSAPSAAAGRAFSLSLSFIPTAVMAYVVAALVLGLTGMMHLDRSLLPEFSTQWGAWLLIPGAYVLCLPMILLVAHSCAGLGWWRIGLLTWLVVAAGLSVFPGAAPVIVCVQPLVFIALHRVASAPS